MSLLVLKCPACGKTHAVDPFTEESRPCVVANSEHDGSVPKKHLTDFNYRPLNPLGSGRYVYAANCTACSMPMIAAFQMHFSPIQLVNAGKWSEPEFVAEVAPPAEVVQDGAQPVEESAPVPALDKKKRTRKKKETVAEEPAQEPEDQDDPEEDQDDPEEDHTPERKPVEEHTTPEEIAAEVAAMPDFDGLDTVDLLAWLRGTDDREGLHPGLVALAGNIGPSLGLAVLQKSRPKDAVKIKAIDELPKSELVTVVTNFWALLNLPAYRAKVDAIADKAVPRDISDFLYVAP